MTTQSLRRGGNFSRWPDINTLAMIAMIIAGALLFVGLPFYAKLQWPGWLLLFVIIAAVWLWALFTIRKNFDSEVSRRLANTRPALRGGLAIVADLLLAAVIAVSVTLFEDYIFAFDISLGGWRNAALYYTAIVFFFRTLRHMRTSLARPAPEPEETVEQATPVEVSADADPVVSLPVNTGPLCYVQAEDHYVKMVFSDNVQHLRARFRDVVAGLDHMGLQVQKSFWVSRDAVSASRRVGRRLHLVLKDGTEIPVSRAMEREVFMVIPALHEPIASNQGA